MNDKALVARIRDGETDAFRELFDRKHRRLYLIAYQVLGDGAAAEDVVQEVFLKLWERCADYDERFSLDGWLRRITTNRAIDHWRSRNVERRHRVEAAGTTDPDAFLDAVATVGESPGAANPEREFGRRQLQAIWNELAAELPPRQRAAFVLRHIEGLAAAEVAAALGCSASTVRSHIAGARSSLQAALRARYPELIDDS